jgi:hypothetical protein
MLAILGLEDNSDGARIRERLLERGVSGGPMYETLERLEGRGLIGPLADRAEVPRKASKRERLMEAVWGYHRDAVRDLLEKERVDPNFVDRRGETPLTAAIDNGDLGTFRLLLEHGADINFGDSSHSPGHPVPFIIFAHALDFLREAVAHGANLRCEPNLFDLAFERSSHLCAAFLYGLDGMGQEFESSENWCADPAAAGRFLRVGRVLLAQYDRVFDDFDALLAAGGFDEGEMARFAHHAISGFVRYIERDPIDCADIRFLERLIQAGVSVETPEMGFGPVEHS